MKKIVILSLSALILTGCGDPNQPAANTNSAVRNTSNTTVASQPKPDDSLVVSSHKSEKSAPPNSSSSMPSSPNQQAIDVSEMTAKIEKAEKDYKAKPTDQNAKTALADAYFERAFALTKAAQYRSALGDFRKGLKLKPDDAEAKDMHDQIISIFESLPGRTVPKEGEEPPPLPYKKQS